ncbi:MAG: methionine synthase [Candidatus Omnitrophica bacterium]|nr:methionine synthase [Candidatus Omnitrophota bacterium]MDD5671041.1 methionine synthase [Candidatus Omnitrophota bacterium]
MKPSFLDCLKNKVLVFDGAMGTNLQKFNLTPEDYGGKDGCNEYLVISKPEAVRAVHESFLKVGCDAVETDTFGANRIVLAEYGLGDRVRELNQKAARLAREVADQYSTPKHPRFVIGSIGPGTKLPSLGHIGFDELKEVTQEQIHGLVTGGVDALLIETCQDLLQSKAAVIAAQEYFAEKGIRLPLMVQVTFETTGTMLLGTEMSAVIAALEMFPVDVIGMNCATGPQEMAEPLRYLCEHSSRIISALPNAGLPENIGGVAHYKLTPADFADAHERFVREFGVSIVGGCCGTSPEHLAAVVDRVSALKPLKKKPQHEPVCASLYQAVSYQQNPAPLLIGEQTNANGSRRCKEFLERNDYEGLVGMAREAVKEGAHLVDVSVAFAGRDEVRDMNETLTRFNQFVPVPVMIDSTEVTVMEAALKHIAGKAIINSANLEDGGKKFGQVCTLAKKYGAGLVVLTIDEKGMAVTRDRKLEIANVIYELATEAHGLEPEDLFFDVLTFTLGSGDEKYRNAAVETLEGIRAIKRNFPRVHTILGVSNISFGLAAHARPVLNSVFLQEAIKAGLDAAIVHAKKILPLVKISKTDLKYANDLIFNRNAGGQDPLWAFIKHFEKSAAGHGRKTEGKRASTIENALKNRIIDGDIDGLEADLDEALKSYQPLDIVNKLLLQGMKDVGEFFGAGKMQLPFVLQSAEVMKKAVAYLERFMDKKEEQEKGRIVLATVRGDVHDIGKNLVDIILTNNGYKVCNLGVKQPVDAILKAARDFKADAIGLSGLLVKSTLIMKEDLEEMNRRGITLPVICGGAALTRRYVEEDLNGLYHGNVYYGRDVISGLRIMDEITQPGYAEKVASIGKIRGAKREGVIETPTADPATATNIVHEHPIPEPPFWGYRMLTDINVEDVFPFINQVALFRAQWQFKRGNMTEDQYAQIIRSKVIPLFAELKAKYLREKILQPRAIYGYYPCYAEGNDLVVLDPSSRKEKTRFTFQRQIKPPFLCLSDYFYPKAFKKTDVLGMQVVTIGRRASEAAQELFKGDKYSDYLYLHGLSVESAEALAEFVHARIRRELGIADSDSPTVEGILQQKYQGARYSFGYSACPNLEDQKKLFELIPAHEIGVSLSETFQLIPEQSTSAIVTHHPQARYFNLQ